jgi:hypothetical protein
MQQEGEKAAVEAVARAPCPKPLEGVAAHALEQLWAAPQQKNSQPQQTDGRLAA